MTRWAAAWAAVGLVSSVATARVADEPFVPVRPDRNAIVLPTASAKPAAVPATDFTLTRDTEVLVNGTSCAYKDVPVGAAIVRVEVGPDRRTIVRIEFRTGR